MQAHALTCTRYFFSLNIIILHPVEKKEGLSYLSICALILPPPPPPQYICNGRSGPELCYNHLTKYSILRVLE
jgi:hypothetical protein